MCCVADAPLQILALSLDRFQGGRSHEARDARRAWSWKNSLTCLHEIASDSEVECIG